MNRNPKNKKTYPSSEYALLEKLKPLCNYKPSKTYPFGVGDDAVVRHCSNKEKLVFTGDSLVEDIHFSLDYMTLKEIGYKAMVSNVSDCAAMGAVPEAALVQIVFPKKLKDLENRLKKIYAGFNESCRKWDIKLIGGDIVSGPCWMISLTLIGRAFGRVLRRDKAKPGDFLWVTGAPGESAAGLAAIKKWGRKKAMARFNPLIDRHVRPEPRVDYGTWLAGNRYVHSCIDVSDGISKECATLAYESRCGILLDIHALPFSSEMIQLGNALKRDQQQWFLHGGEDYELLWSADPRFTPAFDLGTATRIGYFSDKVKGVYLQYPDEKKVRLSSQGWDHVEKNDDSAQKLQK
ncbi:MAG: thiamine-phosphate kinase [Chitinivibrionales bacterium]|nr:thiamine-phosphate kinase [Chitinivibrionales bacterium]